MEGGKGGVKGTDRVDGWRGESVKVSVQSLSVRGRDEVEGLEVLGCDLSGVGEVCCGC